jgi:ribosomal protein S27E
VQDHFEQLEMHWPQRYASRYGFWRPYVTDVVYRYLECGDLHFGFARVKCQDCGHEYLLAYSCKRRHFCPSCHQKRVVEFGEWLCSQVLKLVPHRQWVFSIPKRLRIYFLFNRKLLAQLSRCAWKVLNDYLKHSAPFDDAVPSAAIAVHAFGDFQQFNPHLHLIATDGCKDKDKNFLFVGPSMPKGQLCVNQTGHTACCMSCLVGRSAHKGLI